MTCKKRGRVVSDATAIRLELRLTMRAKSLLDADYAHMKDVICMRASRQQ